MHGTTTLPTARDRRLALRREMHPILAAALMMGVTVGGLAADAEIRRTNLYKYISGEWKLSDNVVRKFAAATSLPEHYFRQKVSTLRVEISLGEEVAP